MPARHPLKSHTSTVHTHDSILFCGAFRRSGSEKTTRRRVRCETLAASDFAASDTSIGLVRFSSARTIDRSTGLCYATIATAERAEALAEKVTLRPETEGIEIPETSCESEACFPPACESIAAMTLDKLCMRI
ncbi:hypothetical protein PUN28_005569 [Cardiocondyla obscurior]|uniref:Uncharacterized protein n=1 Tax=Cardiocondyla obscurior TaxID=286306 RepID=A0AAW2GJD5_9HYME